MRTQPGITLRGGSGRRPLPTISVIEEACDKAARVLDHGEADEITLLRSGRLLKAVNRDLTLMVQWSAATAARSHRLSRAEGALRAMEVHLRHVLLGHASLTRRQIRTHLNQAVCEAFDVLALLRPVSNASA